jgi:hypothetical protein
MRRLLAPVLCSVLLFTSASPAVAAIHSGWRLKLGIRLQAVAAAPDGSIYVVGDKRDSITAKAFLAKLKPDGTRLWTRAWLPNVHASTNAVALDLMPNGNIAWTGTVQQQCESNGWFVQVNRPNGTLARRYVTPGWQCPISAENVTDIAASADRIVVTGYTHGCCGDPYQDGWVQALDTTAHPTWRTNVEPPASTPHAWFDRATGVSIGAFGNMYVAGWGATKSIPSETSRSAGTMVLWKLTSGGGVLWSHRVGGVPMPSLDTPVAVAARGNAVMLAAGVRGFDVRWHLGSSPPTDGWLGRFTTGGSLVWSRDWDVKNPHAAEATNVAIDTTGATWVVGTRRTVHNKGLDMFVRRYSAGGGRLGKVSLNRATRFLNGTGVAARLGGGAYVTGWVGEDLAKSGRLWRFFA